MERGIATFTLDTGRCPRWLFERMVRLGRELVRVLVQEYGPDEFIRRIADPVWFQSLGTVLAFDWNSSGLTTILTAALKEAIRFEERDLGIFICGGKGKTSRKTPDEIVWWGERLALPEQNVNNLVYNSRMAAKVDSALVQDGFQIYHHSFFFSKNGSWSVVQQGMKLGNQNDFPAPSVARGGAKRNRRPERSEGRTQKATARRYHWYSESINDLVCEPHAGILSEVSPPKVLNLVARQSGKTREISTELAQAGFAPLMKEIRILRKYASPLSQMVLLAKGGEQLTLLNLEDIEFRAHPVVFEDFAKSKYLEKILARVTDEKPKNYEKLVAIDGVGPKTLRALALVAEVIYGAEPSYEDPARYSFAHGGKDATPYPVDREIYDRTIAMLEDVVRKTHMPASDKQRALKRLGAPV